RAHVRAPAPGPVEVRDELGVVHLGRARLYGRPVLYSIGREERLPMLVEMVVESVRVNLQTYQRVVVLKEKGADRYLPIWIGNNEADAIVIQLQSVPVPRPQTHDLLK